MAFSIFTTLVPVYNTHACESRVRRGAASSLASRLTTVSLDES